MIKQIDSVLDGARYGERRKRVEEIARTLGVSVATVYRRLQRQKGRRKTVSRGKEIPDEYIDLIAQIKAEGMRYGEKERELPTWRCIRILEQQGRIPEGVLKPSTVNRRLRERGFRQRKAAVRYEAEFANQAHQMDFSRPEYFELVTYDKFADDYIVMVNARGLSYKNKGKKERLWVVQLKDEYSRIRLVRYYPAAGENTFLGLEFLRWAWGREADDHPLRYPPLFLRTDNGSFAKSQYTRHLFADLNIEWLPSEPYNKRSLGKVERGWRDLWRGWELETALRLGDKATLYLNDLNRMVHNEMVRELQMRHPTRNGKRGDLYRRSLLEYPPRQVELDTLRLAYRVLERSVNIDATIRLDNELYLVPEIYAGQRIRVYQNMHGELLGESIDRGKRFKLEPFEAKTFGEYKRYKDTYRERMEKDYKAAPLLGEGPVEEVERAPDKVLYLPPQPQPLQPETPFREADEEVFESTDAARMYIGRRLGVNYMDVATLFDELLQITLSRSEIDAVLARVEKELGT